MNTKTILVVDDNDRMITLANEALEKWNETNSANGRIFDAAIAKSPEGAAKELFFRKIDCALIDLRLPSVDLRNHVETREDSESGNRLAAELLRKVGIPVAIISGFPEDADPSLVDDVTVKAFGKADDGYELAVSWLADQWELMDALRAVRQKLEQSTAEVFSRRIWPNWSQMADAIGHDSDRLATAIARQYASHTAEFLGQEGDDWHPFESFIVPSYVDGRAHTGDIFYLEGVHWIVLTPQCDMATEKVENVLLAECSLGVEGGGKHLNALREPASDAQREKAARFFRDLVNQKRSASVHFLPPIPGLTDPLLVQFGKIRTMPLDELNGQLKTRVASVSPQFLSNLVQRFGAFISRTGQPNIDVEHL